MLYESTVNIQLLLQMQINIATSEQGLVTKGHLATHI